MFRILLLAFLLIITLHSGSALAASSCKGKRPDNYVPISQRYQRGLLFKVGQCGKAPSFILGTVHSDDPFLERTVSYATSILKQSQAAGFEYIEPANAAELTRQYLFIAPTDNTTLPDLIGAENFEILAKEIQKLTSFTPETSKHLKPWAAAIILQYPAPVADGKILDRKLQHIASTRSIPLFGLETMEEQFRIFDSMPLASQLAMLTESLQDIDEIKALNGELLRAYKAEDLLLITELAEENLQKIEDKNLRNLLEVKLLTERNRIMARRMGSELKEGKRFIAVGALHLLGEGGILALLEKKNYIVEPLSSQFP